MLNAGGLDADNDFLLENLYLHGAMPFPYDDPLFTGAMLSTDGSNNPDERQSENILVKRAFLVNMCNAAANIAGGSNVRYDELYIANSGLLPISDILPNGGKTRGAYAGIGIGDFYGKGKGKGNTMSNVLIGFMRTKDVFRREDMSPGWAFEGQNIRSMEGEITLFTEAMLYSMFTDYNKQHNITVGSRVKW